MATANIKAVITAQDRASAVIGGVGASFSKMAGAMAVGNVAAQAFEKALDLVVKAAKSAITQAASFEQTRIGLENMLGSADKARVLLKDISKFAAETPFEFPELAQATRQLVAFGFSAEDAFNTMKQLGDVSAAVGTPINDLAYLMGTLKTQGRAFTIDIRQFAQRGIPIYEYLAKVLNTNTEELTGMIEAGKVGFPQVQEAFQLMTKEGGKFHGTMAKQSKSLSGLWSTLKDNIGATSRALVGITDQGDVLEGGVFDRLRDAVSRFIEILPQAMLTMQDFWNNGMMPIFRSIADVATRIYNFLLPSLTALWQTFETQVYPTMKRLYEEVLKPIAPVIGTVLVAAIWLAINALNFWWQVWTKIMNVGISLFTFMTVTLPAGIKTAFDFIVAKAIWLKDNFWEVVGRIIAFFATLPVKLPLLVVGAFVKIIQYLASINWGNIFAGIWHAFGRIFETVKTIAVNAFQWIKGINWGEALASIGKGLANALIGLIEGAINGALDGIPGVPDVKLPRFANGTNFAPGGAAIVGERGAEIVNLPRGSQVIPNHQIGSIGGGGNISVNVNVGMYAGSEMEKRKMAEALFEALKDLAGSKNTTVARMMGV